MANQYCLICKNQISELDSDSNGNYLIKCVLCGHYKTDPTVYAEYKDKSLTKRQQANIRGFIAENKDLIITTEIFNRLLKITTPSFNERADKLLLFLERQTEYAGQFIQINTWQWMRVAWCLNKEELCELLGYLESTTRVLRQTLNYCTCYKIIFQGWSHIEKLKKRLSDSDQGFVAMWFDEKMEAIYNNAIAKAICDAGYKPYRVDKREHINKIDDEIIVQIRRSRFVVADFTGHRGGVYFEAGFAKGLGIEVFWTCNKKDFENIHFDIRQYNFILWEKDELDEFRKRLANRIESVLGKGSYNCYENQNL